MDINIIGVKTLYLKEVRRFLKVYNQTLFAPVITSLLFLAIFKLALGDHRKHYGGVDFTAFMASGLIMMAMVQNAFANTSSSLILGKVMGVIVDYLTPPLTALEVVGAMAAAALTRGIFVGILVYVSVAFIAPMTIVHPFYVLLHSVLACLLLGLLGLLGGILAETFDQMAAVTNYVITPLSFLSGTFYSVKDLPEFWYVVSKFNPFFYMIDGFRYGLTGYHDGSLEVGILVMSGTTLLIGIAVHRLFASGYRLKH
jgi:ABC-2 type transport system permease protein